MSAYSLFKKLAFSIDAERAHDVSMAFLERCPLVAASLAGGERLETISHKRYQVSVPGLGLVAFPVGLAAGLDKNGRALNYFSRLWFGAVEIGTVTPKPQAGNPKPRLFRYIDEESLRNCFGFNNEGAEAMVYRLKKASVRPHCLGVNLGKNKDTPSELANLDYQVLYEKFSPLADYLVINISSPNTPGLRDLQASENLELLLKSLDTVRAKTPCPLFLKLAPDLAFEDLKIMLNLALKYKLQGIIATNTTIMPERGAGGVSGKLLSAKSQAVRSFLLSELKGVEAFSLIGVGGISDFSDLWKFWQEGGRMVQIYTSFIYQGPEILDSIKDEIDRHLDFYGFETLEEMLNSIHSLELLKK